MTPPFTVPDPTDPTDQNNASEGAQEFRTFKDYVVSWISVLFSPTTGQLLNSIIFPASAIPPLTGDVTSPTPTSSTTSIVTNVGKINGITLSGLPTGILSNTTGTGKPTVITALPNGTTATTQGQNDNSTKVATTAYVNTLAAKGQFLGTATNDNAIAGNIGEFVSSAVASPGTSLTTATGLNVTSISLTAGDWDVEGNVNFTTATATVTASVAGISTTSITTPTDGTEVYAGIIAASAVESATLPRKRISISVTTTVYLVAKASFSGGTMTVGGYISARRAR